MLDGSGEIINVLQIYIIKTITVVIEAKHDSESDCICGLMWSLRPSGTFT